MRQRRTHRRQIDMKLFTISEFARLRNININSLRYYEKIGILKPVRVDAQTGYRYYSPDQLPILDVILLCLDFGMPLKELKSYIDEHGYIQNNDLFEAGSQIAKERVLQAQTELNKIEYTLQYLKINQRYSEQIGLYEREIPERRIIATEYTGDLTDIKKIEITSAVLYEYAQGKQLAPVFPAGIILDPSGGQIKAKIFFEIMAKEKQDVSIASIPEGTFLCRQLDLDPSIRITDAIGTVYGDVKNGTIIVSNFLLDKYQIGTKKSELQKRILV